MSNTWFQCKQFLIHQDRCAMKVTTDGCLFGAWVAERVRSQEPGVGSLLDIGTGTGLLPLMIAQKNERIHVDAIEIERDTYTQACENIMASPWADQITIIQGDVRTFEFPDPYDIIISNPPFYENELKSDSMKKNIAHHQEGLLLTELMTVIKKNLKPGGIFFLLLPFKRQEDIRKMMTGRDLAICELIFVRQTTRHDYFRVMLSGKTGVDEKREIKIDEISIKNDPSSGPAVPYTPVFINLLKDYYLHL